MAEDIRDELNLPEAFVSYDYAMWMMYLAGVPLASITARDMVKEIDMPAWAVHPATLVWPVLSAFIWLMLIACLLCTVICWLMRTIFHPLAKAGRIDKRGAFWAAIKVVYANFDKLNLAR